MGCAVILVTSDFKLQSMATRGSLKQPPRAVSGALDTGSDCQWAKTALLAFEALCFKKNWNHSMNRSSDIYDFDLMVCLCNLSQQ